MEFVLHGFNIAEGTYPIPPNKFNSYDGISNKRFMNEIFITQNRELFKDISKELGPSKMTGLKAAFTTGKDDDIETKCAEDDGVMAVHCLMPTPLLILSPRDQKYGRVLLT